MYRVANPSRLPVGYNAHAARLLFACLLLNFVLASGSFSASSLLAKSPAPAPDEPGEAAAPKPTELSTTAKAPLSLDAVEGYLQSRQLKTLLSDHLSRKFETATGAEKARLGERLARLMFQQLGTTADVEAREKLADRAKAFIKAVPDSRSIGLRIELLRTAYLKSEQEAEQLRIGAGNEAGRSALISNLVGIHQQLLALGLEAHRRTRELEAKLDSGRSNPQDEEDVTEARGVRSRAYYFAGWAGVYAAELLHSGQLGLSPIQRAPGQSAPEALASAAMDCFGWHTGRSAFERPMLDRIARSTIKYEHVARAVLGVAAACSLTGNDAEALKWLALIDDEPQAAPAAKAASSTLRIDVLLRAARFNDAKRALAELRTGGKTNEGVPLPPKPDPRADPAAARLIASISMRLLADTQRTGTPDRSGELAGIVETCLSDLIAAGRISAVLELAERFGTSAIADKGFVGTFVRGMLRAESALSALRAERGGTLGDAPATEAATINELLAAAEALDASTAQEDARSYPVDLARAFYASARARYFAGRDMAAAESARRSFELAEKTSPAIAQDALWLAILCLERESQVAGSGLIAGERLGSTISLFITRYSGTQRAATLLVRRPDKSGLPDAKVVETLLAVEPDSTLYLESRRAAVRVLYRMFRENRSAEGQFIARRFIAVAQPVLEADRKLAMASTGPDAARHAEATLTLIRQALDVALALSPADASLTEQLLGAAQSITAYHSMSDTRFGRELLFRRLQLALTRNDFQAADSLQVQLDAPGDGFDQRFADAGNRLLFLNAKARLKSILSITPLNESTAVEQATRALAHGQPLLFRRGVLMPGTDTASLVMMADVAEAAEVLARFSGDSQSRELALTLYRAVLMSRPSDVASLTGLATLLEAAGDLPGATEAWKSLAAASKEGERPWFVARYNTIRLISRTNPAQARLLMAQHAALYPTLAPAPLGQKFTELRMSIEQTAAVSTPPPAPAISPVTPIPAGSGGGR